MDRGGRQLRRAARVGLFCFLAAASARPVLAQAPWTDRGFVSLNVGAQLNTELLSQSVPLDAYLEEATLRAAIPNQSVLAFDAGGTLRLWRNIGVSLALSRMAHTGRAEVEAAVPHPFYFNRPRTVDGDVPGVSRREVAVHTGAVYVVVSQLLNVAVFGGPSFFDVEQVFVTELAVQETYPYDSAGFAGASVARAAGTKLGFNAGADVTWRFASRWGVGGTLRFSRASVPVAADAVDFGSVEAGGLQGGAGVRMFF